MRCLVIGGTGSIGRACCELLHREGAELAFTTHQRQAEAAELAQALGARAWRACDLHEPASVLAAIDALVAALGGLDALVLATGSAGDSELLGRSHGLDRLAATELSALDALWELNTRGAFVVAQHASALMAPQGHGNIVILGSLDGVKAVPSPVHLAITKAALRGMVEAMAREIGGAGLCINLIAPGLVAGGASVGIDPGLRARYLKHCGLGRLATPAEVAELATWLALENSYLTGQCLLLDGGL